MAGTLSSRRDGHSSGTPVAGRLKQPTRATRPRKGPRALLEPRMPLLFGFAPGGACHAADVAACAVRSYRTLSPLPRSWALAATGGLLSVALSLGFPPPDVIRRRIRIGARTFLRFRSGGRPADWLPRHRSPKRWRSRTIVKGERAGNPLRVCSLKLGWKYGIVGDLRARDRLCWTERMNRMNRIMAFCWGSLPRSRFPPARRRSSRTPSLAERWGRGTGAVALAVSGGSAAGRLRAQ